MLVEGIVGLLALIAACTLHQNDYFAINAKGGKHFRANGTDLPMRPGWSASTLIGRTGGRGDSGGRNGADFQRHPRHEGADGLLVSFRHHVRGSFHLNDDRHRHQGRAVHSPGDAQAGYKPMAKGPCCPALLSRFRRLLRLVLSAEGRFDPDNLADVRDRKPALGVIALAIGTTYILMHRKKRSYALTTFIPFLFLAVTIFEAGIQFIQKMLATASGLAAIDVKATAAVKLMEIARKLPGFGPGKDIGAVFHAAIVNSRVDAILTGLMMALAVVVMVLCSKVDMHPNRQTGLPGRT